MIEKQEMKELIGALHILAGTATLALLYKDQKAGEEYLEMSKEFNKLIQLYSPRLSVDEMFYLREKTVEWMPRED